jgi:predicted ATPase
VPLGSRASEILILLVERAGEVVSRDDIFARVWPGVFVDESNLRVHISGLRKALGEHQAGQRYIINLPGRGYSFVAPLTCESRPNLTRAALAESLPVRLLPVIGRETSIADISASLRTHRLVTVTGSGGIGKTTLAIAIGDELAAAYEHGVVFADLGTLTNADQVADTVATAFGVPMGLGEAQAALRAFVRDRDILLLLDCCEPVIHAAAQLVEALLKTAPRLHVLATSREPLRAEGERTYQLPPMAMPPGRDILSAEAAQTWPAIRLFVERAAAAQNDFVLSDQDVPLLTDICRRLDGIPLAIELAAPRVAQLGLQGLAEHLDDRFGLLLQGRRTALPRHQTLRATLDWSYDLLTENERTILRRVAIFSGGFTTLAAREVAGGDDASALDAVGCVAGLLSKSLIVNDAGDVVQHRLLDTTRAYALARLRESGELETVARSHALYFSSLFGLLETEWETRPIAPLLAIHGRQINNVRAALDWAFSPCGDTSIGVALTVAAVPLWMHSSLMAECHLRVERALANGEFTAGESDRREMKLLAALGASMHYARNPVSESGPIWSSVLRIAETRGDVDYQLRAVWGLWNQRTGCGDHHAALALAEQFQDLAERKSDPAAALIGDRIIGASLYYIGDETDGRRRIEHMLNHYIPPENGSHTFRFQSIQRIAARSNLSWMLWTQGLPDQAMGMALGNIDDAEARGHAVSMCHALEALCLVALYTGDQFAAERGIAMLRDHATRHGVGRWEAWGRCFEGALRVQTGDLETGTRLLDSGLAEQRKVGFVLHFKQFSGELAAALCRSGDIEKALATVEAELAQCEHTGIRHHVGELRRVKGEILLRTARHDAVRAAEDCFSQAMDMACEQGALAWELRAAMSLARLRREQGDIGAGHDLLAAVYERFTEGFQTADVRAAKALLDEMARTIACNA